MKPKIFISHSIDNHDVTVEFVEKFSTHNNHREILWDKELPPGNYHKTLERYAKTCDIAILMINSAFIQSDYCNNIELPILKEREGLNEVIIIPIYFQSCDYKTWNETNGGGTEFFQIKSSEFKSTRFEGPGSIHKNKQNASYGRLDDEDKHEYHVRLKSYIDKLFPLDPYSNSKVRGKDKSPSSTKLETPSKSINAAYQGLIDRSLSIQVSSNFYSTGVIVGKESGFSLHYVVYMCNSAPKILSITPGNEAKIVSTKRIIDINQDLHLAIGVFNGPVADDLLPFWEHRWGEKDNKNTNNYVVIGSTSSLKHQRSEVKFHAEVKIENEKVIFDKGIYLYFDSEEIKDIYYKGLDDYSENLTDKMRGSIIYDYEKNKIIGVLKKKTAINEFSFLSFDLPAIGLLKNEESKAEMVVDGLMDILNKSLSESGVNVQDLNYIEDLIDGSCDIKDEFKHNTLLNHLEVIKDAYYFKRREFLDYQLPVFLSTTFREQVNCFLSVLKKITHKIRAERNNEIQFNSRLVVTFLLLECIKKHFESNDEIKKEMDLILDYFIENTNVKKLLFLPDEAEAENTAEMLKAEREMLYELLLGGEKNNNKNVRTLNNKNVRTLVVDQYYEKLRNNKDVHNDAAVILLFLTLPEGEPLNFLKNKDIVSKGAKHANVHNGGGAYFDNIRIHSEIQDGVITKRENDKTHNWLVYTKHYYQLMIKLNHLKVRRVHELF